MPSMILSNAASTPVDGAVFDVDLGCVAVDEVVDDLVVLFGDGEGLATTVRVRVEGDMVVEEFVFCANTAIADEIPIKPIAKHLFSIATSWSYFPNSFHGRWLRSRITER